MKYKLKYALNGVILFTFYSFNDIINDPDFENIFLTHEEGTKKSRSAKYKTNSIFLSLKILL